MARPIELPYDIATRCEQRYAGFEAMRGLGAVAAFTTRHALGSAA